MTGCPGPVTDGHGKPADLFAGYPRKLDEPSKAAVQAHLVLPAAVLVCRVPAPQRLSEPQAYNVMIELLQHPVVTGGWKAGRCGPGQRAQQAARESPGALPGSPCSRTGEHSGRAHKASRGESRFCRPGSCPQRTQTVCPMPRTPCSGRQHQDTTPREK